MRIEAGIAETRCIVRFCDRDCIQTDYTCMCVFPSGMYLAPRHITACICSAKWIRRYVMQIRKSVVKQYQASTLRSLVSRYNMSSQQSQSASGHACRTHSKLVLGANHLFRPPSTLSSCDCCLWPCILYTQQRLRHKAARLTPPFRGG